VREARLQPNEAERWVRGRVLARTEGSRIKSRRVPGRFGVGGGESETLKQRGDGKADRKLKRIIRKEKVVASRRGADSKQTNESSKRGGAEEVISLYPRGEHGLDAGAAEGELTTNAGAGKATWKAKKGMGYRSLRAT